MCKELYVNGVFLVFMVININEYFFGKWISKISEM